MSHSPTTLQELTLASLLHLSVCLLPSSICEVFTSHGPCAELHPPDAVMKTEWLDLLGSSGVVSWLGL